MKLGPTTRVPASKCLSCGKEHDSGTAVDSDAVPDPGSISVCIQCGHLMAFADDLTLRELTREEQIAIAGDERILAVQRARGYIGADKPKGG